MRFNKRLTFVTDSDSYYDPVKGDYVEGEKTYNTVPCNISSLKVDRTKELFGEIYNNIVVARLQRPYDKTFDYIVIDGKKQNIKHRSDYRKGVFYLERNNDGN